MKTSSAPSRPGSGQAKPRLALDIETHGDLDVLHPVERPLVSIALFDGQGAVVIPRALLGPADYQGRDRAWPGFLELLSRFSLELHNGMFDIPTMCSRLAEPGVDPETYGVRVGFDTMLSHYVIRPAAEQGLKPLAKTLLGADDWDDPESFPRLSAELFEGDRAGWWKHAYPVMVELVERRYQEAMARALRSADYKRWLKKHQKDRPDAPGHIALGVLRGFATHLMELSYDSSGIGKMSMKELADEPSFMVHLYNAYDVVYTWGMREALTPYLRSVEGAADAVVHLHEFANAIMWDELYGFPVDQLRSGDLCTLLEKEVAERRARLVQMAHTWLPPEDLPKGEFNPGSPKQVKEYYAQFGVRLSSTDEKHLGELAKKGDQFAQELLAYRSVAKELSTYAVKARDAWNDVQGYPALFPWYQLARTLTGRLSSSGVTNIQNWPKQEGMPVERQLRSVFVPRPGPYTLAQVDYSQAELRVAAAESGDDWLMGIFADTSVDIFTQMTRQIFPRITDPREIKLWRRPLKSVVYGLMFGRGAPAIARELKIPVQEAQAIVDGFLGLADDLADWRMEIMRKAVYGEDIVTKFGRHFQHEVITPRNRNAVKRSALSFVPQSTASDITLTAYIALRKWIRAEQKDWTFRAVVHDALTYDVPVEEAEYAVAVIGDFMSKAATKVITTVPFAVDGNIANNWAET